MPLIPTPFPEKSLKHEYAYRRQVKVLADSNFNEEKLSEVLKFQLSGLDFFEHRGLILNGIEEKRLLSARIGAADILINQLSYNGPNTGSIADIEAIVCEKRLDEFYERFKAANQLAIHAPFVFYQYAFVRELRLLKIQASLLEREGNRAYLENHYDTVPQKIEEFVYSKVAEFKAIMDGELDGSGRVVTQGIFDYPRKRCIEQILAVRGGKLNPALTDPCVRPFVSKIDGVRVGGAISSDQLLGYESIDAAAKEIADNRSKRRIQGTVARGALAEIFMKTGGGKTYMSEKVKQNYVSEGGLFNGVLNFSLNSTQAELEMLQGEESLEGKIVQLDEAYFYGRYPFLYEGKSNQTLVEEARNDLIENLIARGALVVTLGASESLAKIKVDLRELDVQILEEEQRLKSEDKEARKGAIDNGKKAIKAFKASAGYVLYKSDKAIKLKYQEALDILLEIKKCESEGNQEGKKKAARKFLKFSDKMHKQNPGESILLYFRQNLKIQDDIRKGSFSIETSNLPSYIRELEGKLAGTFKIAGFEESHWKTYKVREAPHLKKRAKNFLPYIKILVATRNDITADLRQNIETIERLLDTDNNSELAELYKAFFSIVTHPDIMSDFNSNDIESTKLVDLKAKRTSRMAQYNELVVRREGGKVNGREVRGKTKERFDSADKFVDQSDFGTGNLYDLVGKYLDKISDQNSEGVKGRMQYVMPHFKITEAKCSTEVLEQIRVKTEADIIIVPQREGDGPLRCRVYYCQQDGSFGVVEMNLGESRAKIERELAKLEENRSGLSGAALENLELDIAGLQQTLARMPEDDAERYLCDLLDGLGEGIKDKKILSFFDYTNSIGGDYGAAGIGVTQQYIHVNDPRTLTWNELMQANRDRTPTANDDADVVKRKFIYHLDLTASPQIASRLKEIISQNTRDDDVAHACGYIRSKAKSLRDRGEILQAESLKAYEIDSVWDEDPLLERAREEELQRGMDATFGDIGDEVELDDNPMSGALFVGNTTPLMVRQTMQPAGGGGRASNFNPRNISFSKLGSPDETKSETMKSSKSTELLLSSFAQNFFDAAQEFLQNELPDSRHELKMQNNKPAYIQAVISNKNIVYTVTIGKRRYDIYKSSGIIKIDYARELKDINIGELLEVYNSLSAALNKKREERAKIENYERKSKELLDLIIELEGYDIDDDSVSYENIIRPANAKKTKEIGSFAKASVLVSGEKYDISFESRDVLGHSQKTVAKISAIDSGQHNANEASFDKVLSLLQQLKNSADAKILQKSADLKKSLKEALSSVDVMLETTDDRKEIRIKEDRPEESIVGQNSDEYITYNFNTHKRTSKNRIIFRDGRVNYKHISPNQVQQNAVKPNSEGQRYEIYDEIDKIGERARVIKEGSAIVDQFLDSAKRTNAAQLQTTLKALLEIKRPYSSDYFSIQEIEYLSNNPEIKSYLVNGETLIFSHHDGEGIEVLVENDGKQNFPELRFLKDKVYEAKAELFRCRRSDLQDLKKVADGRTQEYNFSVKATSDQGSLPVRIISNGEQRFDVFVGNARFQSVSITDSVIKVTNYRGAKKEETIIDENNDFRDLQWLTNLIKSEKEKLLTQITDNFLAIVKDEQKPQSWTVDEIRGVGYSATEKVGRQRYLKAFFSPKSEAWAVSFSKGTGAPSSSSISDLKKALGIQREIEKEILKQKLYKKNELIESIKSLYDVFDDVFTSESDSERFEFKRYHRMLYRVGDDSYEFKDESIYKGKIKYDVRFKTNFNDQSKTPLKKEEIDALVLNYRSIVDSHKKIISDRIRENHNEILRNEQSITSWEIKGGVLFVKKGASPSQDLNDFAVIDGKEGVLVAKANRSGQWLEQNYSQKLGYLDDVLKRQEAILNEIALNKNKALFRQILGEDSRGNIKDGDYEFSSSSATSPQIGGVKFIKNGENYTVKIGQKEYNFSQISLEDAKEMHETVSRLMKLEELHLTDKLKEVLSKVEADKNLEDVGDKDLVTSISEKVRSGSGLICDLDYALKMLGNVEQKLGDFDIKRKAVDDLRVVTHVDDSRVVTGDDDDIVVLEKKFYRIESKFQVREIDLVKNSDGTINEIPKKILSLEELKKLTSDYLEKQIEDVKFYQEKIFAYKKYLKSWKAEQHADGVACFTKTTPPEFQFYTHIVGDGSLHIRLPDSPNYLRKEPDQIAYSKDLHFIWDQYDEMWDEIKIIQATEISGLFEEVFHEKLDEEGDNLKFSQSVFTSESENHKAGSIFINSDLVKETVKVAGGSSEIIWEQPIADYLTVFENVRNQLQQDIEREKEDQLRKIEDSLAEIERNKKFLPEGFKLEGKRLSKGRDIIVDGLSKSSRLGDVRFANYFLQKINEFIAEENLYTHEIKEALLRVSQDIFAPDSTTKEQSFGDNTIAEVNGNLLLRNNDDEQTNSLCVLDPNGVLRIKEDIRAEELSLKLSEIEQDIAARKIAKSQELLGSTLDKIFADEDSIFYEGRTLRRVFDGKGKVGLDVLDEETNTKHSYSLPDQSQAAQYQGAEVKTHQLQSLEVLLEGVTQQLEEKNTRRQKLARRMRSAPVMKPNTTKSEVYADLSRFAMNSDKGLATVEFVFGLAEKDSDLAQELDKAKTQEAKYKVAKAYIAKNSQLGAQLEEFIKSKGISAQDHQKRTYALIESEFAKMDKSLEQRSPSPTLTARMHNLFKTESVQVVKSNGNTVSGGNKGGGGRPY